MERPESFEDICTIYYGLAEKINKAEKAANIINKAKSYVNIVRVKSSNYSSLKVFWEIGSNPLYTAGGKSFANDYNFYSNTINMYSGVNKNYFQLDMEDVVSRNLDIILIINLGKAAKTESAFWYKYKILNASQNNRIFAINSEDMFAPTPLTFAENLMLLAKIVHGDIFDVK
jgi:ABC-type Fe3+-hydroxamate transport system substrate-binding protein